MYNKMYFSCSLVLALTVFTFCGCQGASNYFGKYLGALKTYHHGLQGDVYVVDSRTLHIRNFNYDGEGPAGYFYISNSKTPNENGIKLRDERGSSGPLKRYRKKHITLTLPEGKTVSNIKWFYVWCDEFSVNFGDVKIPKNLEFPKPQKIDKFAGVHSVSSDNVVVVDAQTLLIPSFSYDGEAPDAKFWVGTGSKPSPQGIRVPDENGKEEPLRRYDKKTIVLTLPGDVTVFDIGNFAIWCEAFTVDFGHIEFPKDLNVPPSLKMLGVSPQSKLNCEILHDDLAFEARWAVAGDSIVIQLVAKLERDEYMSFGVSGQIDRNTMIGGDVVVAWIDHETLNGFAYDYYLDAKSQCAGGRGSCPDAKVRSNTESIRLLNAALVNGYSIVTYQRPLGAHDELDSPIYTNGSQAIIWAIGPLNSLQEVSYHGISSKATTLIDFGRPPQWNCPIPESDATVDISDNNENYDIATTIPTTTTERVRVTTEPAIRTRIAEITKPASATEIPRATSTKSIPKRVEATPAPVKREKPWDIPPIQCYEPEDGIYYAQMGPTGGKRGYSAITGHVGWGIAWYINGLLIPEVNVVRGRTYTFVVEGGFDPEIPAKYHPFYITDDPVGGYHYKTPDEKAKIQIFAGVMQSKNGELVPTGIGRLCNWTPDPDQPPSDEFASFGAYQRTLSLVCDHGEPGVVQWTPDEYTPDTVYYQCFSHRYLGWKINVHDNCDKESEPVTNRVRVHDDEDDETVEGELQSKPSVQVVTRVKPANSTDFPNQIPKHGAKESPLNVYTYKDPSSSLKHEYTNVDQLVLQDPYVPPPPYQKNFDYQTMQQSPHNHHQRPSAQPMNTVNTFTEKTAVGDYLIDVSNSITMPVISNYGHTFGNTKVSVAPSATSPKPKLTSYPYSEPYPGYKPPVPGASKYHPPSAHIHVVEHVDPHEEVMPVGPGPQKSYPMGGRPLRRPLMAKNPNYKPAPRIYPSRSVSKKQTEQPAIASIPPKSIRIASSVREAVPKVPQGVVVSYYAPPQQKPGKPARYVATRKREEPKPHFTSRVKEYPQPKHNSGFDPNSIVIESGFKPIVPSTESQSIAQERMSEDGEDYIEQELKEANTENTSRTVAAEDHSKNPFEGKQTELFEPVFIPSPVISEQQRKKKKPALEERQKVKAHKPGQNSAYIWPAEEAAIAGATIRKGAAGETRFNAYDPFNTISAPHYKAGTEKVESGIDDNVVIDTYRPPPVNIKASPSVTTTHNYKVIEPLINGYAEVNDINNSRDRSITPPVDEMEKTTPEINPANHKIKYIPITHSKKKADSERDDESKQLITIPTEDSTETANGSSMIKL